MDNVRFGDSSLLLYAKIALNMEGRRGQTRKFKYQGRTRTVGMTTEQIRDRKAARERIFKRPRDLRLNIDKKTGNKSQERTTEVVDAREKLLTKRFVEKLPEKTSISIDQRRKELRSDIIARNRSLSLDSGSIKITAKQNLPPNRSAKFAGQSIKITAKVESKSTPKANPKDRNAKMFGSGRIAITAKSTKAGAIPKGRREGQDNGHRKKETSRESYEEYEYFSSPPRNPTPLADRLDHGPSPQKQRQSALTTSTKVTITNLHPTVSRQDIEELFGAVGVLKSCKMLRPGAAEVVYTTKEDAVTAFARYHNRNLDGQPMQCKLCMMPSSAVYTAPAPRPLPPLRPAAVLAPRSQAPITNESYQNPFIKPTSPLSRPVIFKVKI